MKGPTVLGEFNSAIIAALGALVVGVLMKFVSKLTDKRKDTLNEHLELRRELREELDEYKKKYSDQWMKVLGSSTFDVVEEETALSPDIFDTED